MCVARAVTDEVGNIISDSGLPIEDDSLDTLSIPLEPIYDKKDYSRVWEKLHEQCLKIDGDFKFDLRLRDVIGLDNYKELAKIAIRKGNKHKTKCKIYRSDEKGTYALITLSGYGFMKTDKKIIYRKGVIVIDGRIHLQGLGWVEAM